MSKINKFCTNCGAAVEGKEFCPQCGAKQTFNAATPETTSSLPPDKVVHEQSRGATEHLTIGFKVAMNNPLVFLPAILSGVIGGIIGFTSSAFFMGITGSIILGLINFVISFILGFASTDMSRDAYNKQPLDLGSSINYVFSRIIPFLIAAIFGGLLSLTVVFIPIVILSFVIMVIDETDVLDAFGKTFNVIRADLGDVLVVLLVAIVGLFITGYIPYVSSLLYSLLNVVLGLAFIDIYANFKNR